MYVSACFSLAFKSAQQQVAQEKSQAEQAALELAKAAEEIKQQQDKLASMQVSEPRLRFLCLLLAWACEMC